MKEALSIAVDAMGGDHAPREVVRGAVEAARLHPELRLLLVGREAAVRAELEPLDAGGLNIEVVHAEAVIDMGDSPVEALRRKKGSSIEVAALRVRSGDAVAMVSAGNTGACVAAATLRLGLLPDVRRAGIAVTFYAGDRPIVVIDVGANVASRPEHLIQYGIMASLYARSILRVENPTVGLLNVGEENEKGNALAKTTHSLFKKTRLNFLGNVEGVEIFRGICDVVVCDGFVGNIVLKVAEGLAERLADMFRQSLEETMKGLSRKFSEKAHSEKNASGGHPTGDSIHGIGKELLGGIAAVRERLDYSEQGGAPLLGVNGGVIIAHGRSSSRAIANAIRAAKRMAETDINRNITEEIRACLADRGDLPSVSTHREA
jgi:glycerol-3-phosphate acyltransferase PlsX